MQWRCTSTFIITTEKITSPCVVKQYPIYNLAFPHSKYKCSAVAEIGDCLATIDMGQKGRAAVPLS